MVITRTTRNRLIGVEPVRGFESHALRHVGASSVSLAPIFYASQKKRSALTPLLLLSKPKPKASVWAAERNHRAFLLKVDPDKSGFVGGIVMWFWLALGSAFFAALTSILAKVGIEGVGSNLATAIRTMVVVIMAWGMVFITHQQGGIRSISQKSWIFLILSGLATGASWLCYYKALQMGDASKVVPIDKLSVVITLVLAFIFLHEDFTAKSMVGCILIGAGTLLMVL